MEHAVSTTISVSKRRFLNEFPVQNEYDACTGEHESMRPRTPDGLTTKPNQPAGTPDPCSAPPRAGRRASQHLIKIQETHDAFSAAKALQAAFIVRTFHTFTVRLQHAQHKQHKQHKPFARSPQPAARSPATRLPFLENSPTTKKKNKTKKKRGAGRERERGPWRSIVPSAAEL